MKIVPYVRAIHDTERPFELYDAEAQKVLHRFTSEEYMTFTINVLAHSESAMRWSAKCIKR